MKRWIVGIGLALIGIGAHAQIPLILLEACNSMEPASKRMQCLKAANRSRSASPSSVSTKPAYAAPTSAKSNTGQRDTTCRVTPSGDTYTITASGRKNYEGC